MRVITNSTLSGGSKDSPEGLGHPTKRTDRTSVHYEGVIIDKTWERKIQKICGMWRETKIESEGTLQLN